MVYEIEKFKKILEYFALHFAKIHKEKDGLNVIDLEIIKEFSFGKNSKSGQGYNDDSIQQYMLEKSKIGETANDGIFSIGNAFQDQKVCISIDPSGGYKGGSYLHLVDKQPNKNAAYGNQTNINPVVEDNSFIAIEIGASTNNPEHIFPPLQYTFNELGLFCASPSFLQEETLKSFLEYYKEMRIAEIKGALTYFGQKQLESTRNMILTGAPGTGKTWSAKNIAAWMIKGAPYDDSMQNDPDFKRQCRFVQFHPSYDYTDFVEGLRPFKEEPINPLYMNGPGSQMSFERKDGIFKTFCKEALDAYNKAEDKKQAPKYIIIIDEINRGEMSKILGELFYSIDPGYRGIDGKVNTQYQNMIKDENDPFKDGFYVPENVYIIGTMNDIDRSVESMDFAMRRRFSFLEVMAKEREDMWNQSIPEWKEYAKVAMEALNDEIEKLPGLSSAYHIGPAYFNKLKLYNGDFFELWDKHLKGVIFEYMRGKKDTETKLKELKAYYINAYAKAIDSRFNSGGKWGKKVIDLWEKSKLPNSFTFNKFEDEKAGSPNDQDKAKNNNKQTKEAIKKEFDNYAISKLNPDLSNESDVKKQIFRALTFGKYIESLK